MAASSSSSSSSSSRQWTYDVFLSFAGEDVGKNFVDHLYSALRREGIRIFKDNEEQERGKEISSKSQNAIEQSRLALIVFSENYAASSRCLDALLKALECKKLKKQMVVPVFYKVDPSRVWEPEGIFTTAFNVHEKVYSGNLEKVQAWRDALEEAANMPGWVTQNVANGHESKCIKEFVRRIFIKLGHIISSITDDDLVGIDSRADEVCSLLDTRWNDVRVLGIWGAKGIGKTTIARVVYDWILHHFEGCFFIAVREIFEKQGKEALQQELRSIISKLYQERALVILDGVDDGVHQIAELKVLLSERHCWDGLGSRIIVTTRDSCLLITHRVDVSYEVKALDESEALQLFCLKAFKQRHPLENFEELSEDVVQFAAGLPLSLIVLGYSLCARSKDEWKAKLRRLKKNSKQCSTST